MAGRFYKGAQKQLEAQIESMYTHKLGPGSGPGDGDGSIIGAVVPHAGLMFSGPVAAHAYARLGTAGIKGRTVVIFGPNHTGMGTPISVGGEDWEMPMGNIAIDGEFANAMASSDQGVALDATAHLFEHSIEVQLPFLQHITDDFKLVPAILGDQSPGSAERAALAVKSAQEGLGRDLLVLASTDFSHYVPISQAKDRDGMAIDTILAKAPQDLYETVKREKISMCGFGPVMATLMATEPDEVELLKYATSGDVEKMSEVVGYASMIFK